MSYARFKSNINLIHSLTKDYNVITVKANVAGGCKNIYPSFVLSNYYANLIYKKWGYKPIIDHFVFETEKTMLVFLPVKPQSSLQNFPLKAWVCQGRKGILTRSCCSPYSFVSYSFPLAIPP